MSENEIDDIILDGYWDVLKKRTKLTTAQLRPKTFSSLIIYNVKNTTVSLLQAMQTRISRKLPDHSLREFHPQTLAPKLTSKTTAAAEDDFITVVRAAMVAEKKG